jgi:hypothetical protein
VGDVTIASVKEAAPVRCEKKDVVRRGGVRTTKEYGRPMAPISASMTTRRSSWTPKEPPWHPYLWPGGRELRGPGLYANLSLSPEVLSANTGAGEWGEKFGQRQRRWLEQKALPLPEEFWRRKKDQEGDTVEVLSGDDKGSRGTVHPVSPTEGRWWLFLGST